MTVSIDIDLNSRSAQVKLGNLKAQLETLDDFDFDFDLEGDLGDKLDELGSKLDDLSASFADDLDEVVSDLEDVEFDPVTVEYGGGDSGGDTGSDSGDETATSRTDMRTLWDAFDRSSEEFYGRAGIDPDEDEGFTPDIDRDWDYSIPDFDADGADVESSFEAFNRNIEETLARMDVNLDEIKPYLPGDGRNEYDYAERYSFDGITSEDDFLERYGYDSSIKGRADNIKELFDFQTASYRASGGENFVGDYDFDFGFGDGGPADNTADMFDWLDMNEKEMKVNMGYSHDADLSEVLSNDRTLFERIKGGGVSYIDNFGDSVGELKTKFRKLVPTMSTWINMVGMAVPALAAMAVNAGAVAASMGAVAGAGAAMIGLGLLGHGDSMAESFQNAKLEVRELKRELFEEFQPTAQLFSGIQAEFFDFIPGQMDRVARAMEGLVAFKPDLFDLFRGGTQFVAEFIRIITGNSDKISEMTERFAGLTGSSILDFFSWLLKTGYQNQGMLVSLGSILKTVAIAVYNVFMMVSRAIIMLRPFFNILSWTSKLLNNSFVSGVVAVVAVVYVLYTALASVAGLLGTGLIPMFSSMFSYLSAYIFQTLAATMANYGLAASIANVAAALGTLMAMTGVGLLLAGGGLLAGKAMGLTDGFSAGGNGSTPTYEGGGIGTSRGSGTIVNNNTYEGDRVDVTINGDTDVSTVEQFKDLRSQEEHKDSTRGPDVNGSYTG